MPSIIAYGTGDATSADIAVADGSSVIVGLEGASGDDSGEIVANAWVKIQLKNSAGKYVTVDNLNTRQRARLLNGPATFRVQRLASSSAIGVYSA